MKKKVILLPLIMMALASCGGNNSSNSTEPKPSNSTSEKPSESTSTKPSESTSTSTVTPVGTTSIADVLKAGFDETAGTTEFTFEGTVVGLIGDNSYYLQQGDAGIYVYKTAATGNAIGKKVKVVSKITNYNGLIETDFASSATVTGDGEAITAVTYTTKTFKKENQCTLANIKGLKYESGSISLGSSAMLSFKEGTENVLVRVDKNLDDSIETAIKEKLESLGGNDTVDFVNTILYMNSKDGVNTVTVGLTSAEQMVINRGEKVAVTGVTADESIEVTVGKTAKITASVVPADASEKGLTFKSNDETKATVDAEGVVTGVAEGNTTITVASKDDATKVATVNVTVKAVAPAPDINVAKFDFSTATEQGTALTNDTALALFNSCYDGETSPLQSVTVKTVYSGNVQGGAFPNASGFLKFSTGKVVGSLSLDFGSLKATSVDIKCHDWYKDTGNGRSSESTITVNDSEAQAAPYTTTPEAQTLTFNFTESNVVTINPSKRIFVFEITVHFAK